jgi:hypothetical protein
LTEFINFHLPPGVVVVGNVIVVGIVVVGSVVGTSIGQVDVVVCCWVVDVVVGISTEIVVVVVGRVGKVLKNLEFKMIILSMRLHLIKSAWSVLRWKNHQVNYSDPTKSFWLFFFAYQKDTFFALAKHFFLSIS